MMTQRRYPIGIQTFSRIIREGYLYIDKTDLTWKLAHYATFVFMSRPRRFGKSLLTSTLESYFRGEQELFKGLKLMELEHEWKSYPVIRLDLSTAKSQGSAEALKARLLLLMKPYRELYGSDADEVTPGGVIDSKGYAMPYSTDGRRVVKVGVKFNADTRIPEEWAIAE